MSYVFYDTETTGIDHDYDQILQIAAVRTDEELNELDRIELRCRLLPHVVPSPKAMLVTGVKSSQLHAPNLPSHYEMMRKLHEKLTSWSPSLFIGWNTIDFDERLLRQAFYKTLHDPYQTVRNGNNRTDALRIAQACSIFGPHALKYPVNKKGAKVFRLDQLAPLNGFAHDNAHDAMGDVKATVFICRMMKEAAPDVWSSFMRFSTKAAVLDYVSEETAFCFTDFYFGRPSSTIVCSFGSDLAEAGGVFTFDLSHDPDQVESFTNDQLDSFVTRSPKPVKRLKLNGAPMIAPLYEAPESTKNLHLSESTLLMRAERLREHTDLQKRIVMALRRTQEIGVESPHLEKQIFKGFPDVEDQERMKTFHSVAWEDRSVIVEKFADPRLRAIGRNLIHLERPDLLKAETKLSHDKQIAKRVLGQTDFVEWRTIQKALQELEAELPAASKEQADFLMSHQKLLHKKQSSAIATLS